MRPRRSLLAAATLVCWAILATDVPPPLVRAPAAVVLLFVLPGAALLDAAGLRGVLGAIEETTLAIGLSCAVTVLLGIGMGLAATLRPLPFESALSAAVLAGLAAGAIEARLRARRQAETPAVVGAMEADRSVEAGRRIEAGGRVLFAAGVPSSNAARSRLSPTGRPLRQAAIATLFVAGSALAVTAVLVALRPGPAEDVVQLWMLRTAAGASIGIGNGTADAAYRLTVGPEGLPPQVIEVGLSRGQTWQTQVTFPSDWPAARAVTARLYRSGDATPLRTTVLASSATPPPSAAAASPSSQGAP